MEPDVTHIQAALLELRVPHPPAGTRFTSDDREAHIRAGKRLPPAFRVPTELSLNYFVRSIVSVPELLSVLVNYRDGQPRIMKMIAQTMTAHIQPNIPQRYRKTVKSGVSATLSNGVHRYYSLEATAERLGKLDYRECCARDHYLRSAYFKRFHAYIIYRFILFMQKKDEQLRAAIGSTSVCIVCQHRAARQHAEGGEQVMWRQAEPCRHWTCDECTRSLIAAGKADRCFQCRTRVMTYALGIAPAGNQ
jgi:hypothetical protein